MRLHGGSTPETRAAAEEDYAIMHDAIKAELAIRKRHLSDLWATPAMVRRTSVAMGVQIFTQCTGINLIGADRYSSLYAKSSLT